MKHIFEKLSSLSLSVLAFSVLFATFSVVVAPQFKAQAQSALPTTEEITSFDSTLQIEANGSVIVTEKIAVVAKGIQIKRGIFRDYPDAPAKGTLLEQLLLSQNSFVVQSVTKNGQPEDYFTEEQTDTITRVYMGDSDINLTPGAYTYELKYTLNNLLKNYPAEDGQSPAYDELYHDITGNEWKFNIQKATAKIILPPGVTPAEILKTVGFTGIVGATAQDFTSKITQENGRTVVTYETTKAMPPGNGLTVGIDIKPGFVQIGYPETLKPFRIFLEISPYLLLPILLFFLVVFYYTKWRKHGKDAAIPAAYPRYDIPEGYSPAIFRFLDDKDMGNKAMVVTLINLGVKGYVKISKNKDDKYAVENTLKPGTTPEKLSEDEEFLYNNLFGSGDNVLLFDNKNYLRVSNAIFGLSGALQTIKDRLYTSNAKYLVTGIILTVLVNVLVAFLGIIDPAILLAMLAVPPLLYFAGAILVNRTRNVSPIRMGIALVTLFICLGCNVIFVPFNAEIHSDLALTGIWLPLLALVVVLISLATTVIHVVAARLLPAYNKDGAEALAIMEGVKMFIQSAEKERIRILYPDLPVTIGTFEKYLPYAIAFDLESKWSNTFKEQIDLAMQDPNYHSSWHDNSIGWQAFYGASFANSLSSAVATSSVSPYSSSSSSGGGFSGGGGGGSGGGSGGGGGGGW